MIFKDSQKSIIDYGLREGIDQSIAEDLVESIVDSQLSNDVLEEIPFVKTIKLFYNVGVSIREQFYFRKLILFISETSKSSLIERNEFLNFLNDNPKVKVKVFNRLIFSLDKFEEENKALYLGCLTNAIIKKVISLDTAIDLIWVLENSKFEDIQYFRIRYSHKELTPSQKEIKSKYLLSGKNNRFKVEMYKVGIMDESIKLIKGRFDGGSKYDKSYDISILGHELLEVFKNC